jgi:hypothetical protein
LDGNKQAKILELEVEKRSDSWFFKYIFTGNLHQRGDGNKQAGQDPGVWALKATTDYLKYLQAAAIKVAQGNKQGKILESDAEKQQLIISYIYRQSPWM